MDLESTVKQENDVVGKNFMVQDVLVEQSEKLPPIPTIHRTKDYSKFTISGNRTPVKKHVNLLVKQMEKIGCFLPSQPIVVNSDLIIDDGQHRFLAAQILNYSICYVIEDNYEDDQDLMTMLNSSTLSWKNENFMDRQAALGNSNYIALKKFVNDYNYRPLFGLRLIRPKFSMRILTQDFKEGSLVIDQDELDTAQNLAEMINDVRNFDPSYAAFNSTQHFLVAIASMILNKAYNHDAFLKSLEGREADVKKKHTIESYLLPFSRIYNLGKRGRKVEFKRLKN